MAVHLFVFLTRWERNETEPEAVRVFCFLRLLLFFYNCFHSMRKGKSIL